MTAAAATAAATATADTDAGAGIAAIAARAVAGAVTHPDAGPHTAGAVRATVDPALGYLEPVMALGRSQFRRAQQGHVGVLQDVEIVSAVSTLHLTVLQYLRGYICACRVGRCARIGVLRRSG